MKTKLNNLVRALALTSLLVGCGSQEEISPVLARRNNSELPKPRENQVLILHPEYLQGQCSLGYTLLTDVDSNGSWDCAERVYMGYSPGSYSKEFFAKAEEFLPARDLGRDTRVEEVGSMFFEKYK